MVRIGERGDGRHRHGATAVAFALAYILFASAGANGQPVGRDQEPGGGFDISRAFIADHTIFEPFHVASTRPLREALAEGVVNDDTPLLVMEHRAGTLALLTEQMAYHHIAQGEIMGEPWMVSF